MILILEIILTIVAWNRGWKAQALIPVGVVFVIGMIIGVLSGGNSDVIQTAILFDILGVVALLVMAIKGKKTVDNKDSVS